MKRCAVAVAGLIQVLLGVFRLGGFTHSRTLAPTPTSNWGVRSRAYEALCTRNRRRSEKHAMPAASDDIADTLDYKAISKRLIDFVSASQYGLVEALAEACCKIILEEFGVARLRLKLSKVGAVRGARAVGVILERSRSA